MAASVHDDILMGTAIDIDGKPVTGWNVVLEGHREYTYAAVQSERGITGKLHVHRTKSAGSVVQFRDYPYTLILTHAEYRALRLLVGKVVYFMPHYRDEGDVASYLYTVLFERMGEEVPLPANLAYWRVGIHLVDAEGNTVG